MSYPVDFLNFHPALSLLSVVWYLEECHGSVDCHVYRCSCVPWMTQWRETSETIPIPRRDGISMHYSCAICFVTCMSRDACMVSSKITWESIRVRFDHYKKGTYKWWYACFLGMTVVLIHFPSSSDEYCNEVARMSTDWCCINWKKKFPLWQHSHCSSRAISTSPSPIPTSRHHGSDVHYSPLWIVIK